MSEKHTPGPWTWQLDDLDGEKWMFLFDGDGHQVLAVPVTVGGRVEDMGPNARLIAAAPELLRTVKALVIEGEASYERDGFGLPEIEAARALIARIEGKP